MRLGVAIVVGLAAAHGLTTTAASAQTAAARPRAITLAEVSAAFEALAAQVSSSTVQVLASGLIVDPDAPAGGGFAERQRASGSGVILDAAGYVMTNYHVIQGARRVQVVLASSRQGTSVVRPRGRTLDATVIGVDEETDLALLKVGGAAFSALPLGDSDALRAGQLVFAFGSPLGLDNTVTMGVVSAVGRQLEPDDPMVYIQTDAPINPGSSGGPLVDAAGRVVGINTLILSQGGGNEGLGFAAPSNIVGAVYDQLKMHGRVRRGSIGALAQSITAVLAEALQLPQDTGALVSDLDPDGPGAAGGLRIGDIVVALDGKAIENGRQLEVNLYRRAAGSDAALDVLRGAERLRLSVAVEERHDDPLRFSELVTRETNGVPRLGVLALSLTPALRQD
ncbi:MAG TPA: trypsin-like peptidase domain-containing protein, partial [Vicinamibacterales bacterium]|nr:trypsin-like peptidase domain-containing protein [Vicinamibacterales bacterium]